MRLEDHDLGGTGAVPCEVYPVESRDGRDFWRSVTNVSCPVEGCDQTVVWYEAGYVPGFRVCMEGAVARDVSVFNHSSKRHHFIADGTAAEPVLIRDRRFEEKT